MYLPKYFKLTELVSRKIYEKRGDMAFGLFDDRLLETLDQLREQFGPLTCNSWAAGGDRQYSGFRASSEPYYSPFSQHSFGRAVDLISKTHTCTVIEGLYLAPFRIYFIFHCIIFSCSLNSCFTYILCNLPF